MKVVTRGRNRTMYKDDVRLSFSLSEAEGLICLTVNTYSWGKKGNDAMRIIVDRV